MDEEKNNEQVSANPSTTGATTTNVQPDSEKKGFNIASMVLGIVSLVAFCFWYISIPCAILAIIFGIVGRHKGGHGMGIAGLVLGIIVVVLWVLLLALAAVGVAYIGNNVDWSSLPSSYSTLY